MAAPPEEPFAEEDECEAAPISPNAADSASHKRIRNRAKREAAERAKFWADILGTEFGRREIWGLIDPSNRFPPSFHKRFGIGPTGLPYPQATHYYDGMRDLGERIWLTLFAADPVGAFAMLKENHAVLRPPPKTPRRQKEDNVWP